MNIVGEGFPNAINDQVIQRQKIYGSGYTNGIPRSNEELVYLNNNTSWVKLVSSVNIDDKSIIQNKSLSNIPGIDSNNLAKKFVLFNGVTDASTNQQRGGVDFGNTLLGNNHAYGIGGTEFGIQPMMGIKSATIKHKNRGSIRSAIVQIKAFNKVQFDIIDLLYLRLGFNILLEWGHSMYYDNKGVLQTKENNSLANEFLSGVGTIEGNPVSLTYNNFLTLITEKKLTSNGNYDAMFAKVTNMHWSFLPDGSYDITLDLISIGDVVESFKINALTNGISSTGNATTSSIDLNTATPYEVIDAYADKNSIGQWFYYLIKKSNSNTQNTQAAQMIKQVQVVKDIVKANNTGENVSSTGIVSPGFGPKY